MDRRLSLYWCGDYLVVADLFSGNGASWRCFWPSAASRAISTSSSPSGCSLTFSRHAAVCSTAGFFRHVYPEIVKGTRFLNAFFRSSLNCTVLALTLNTCAYTTEIFAGAIRSVTRRRKLKPPGLRLLFSQTVSLHYSAFRAAYCATGLQ